MKLTIFIGLLFSILFISIPSLAKNVDYQVNGKTYQGYFIKKSSKAPLVLLLHDWDGLTGYEVKRAKMLHKLGYSVFAADLFGKGIRPTENKDKRQHTGELYKDRKKLRDLINGALDTAKKSGLNVKNAVAIGYCFGGAGVLELARSGKKLKGFVTFHGGLGTPKGQDYKKLSGELLILHGGADSAITMDDFANLAKELEIDKATYEMIAYSGAPHAFTVYESQRYNKIADQKSWARFLAYLKRLTK